MAAVGLWVVMGVWDVDCREFEADEGVTESAWAVLAPSLVSDAVVLAAATADGGTLDKLGAGAAESLGQ